MKKREDNRDSLLSRWKNKKKAGNGQVSGITKIPENEAIPLSYGQQSIWFLQQLYPDNPFYNYSEGYSFIGKLEVPHLISATKQVCHSHDILSSTYHLKDGKTVQRINKVEVEIPIIDLSELGDADQKEQLDEISLSNASKCFDLTKAPLYSIVLVKLSEEEHLLLVTLHHIITDKWSMDVFRKELALHYKALSSIEQTNFSKSEIQYTDYAYWQKSQNLNEEQLSYWKGKLRNAPSVLDIPTDHPRPSKPSYKGALHTKVYSESLSTEVLNLAKKLETTPYTLLLAVYYVLLYRYSGQKDILVGSPIANRNNTTLEQLMGFFNDTVVLRNTVSGSMTFLEVLQKVKEDVLASFSNKDIPFDYLVKSLKPERSSDTNPFFQVMFLYHKVPPTPDFGPDLKLYHTPLEVGVSKFDLTLYISEDKGIMSTTFEYATDLYQEETIDRFQNFYRSLLKDILENQHRPIFKIGATTAIEQDAPDPDVLLENDIWSTCKGIHSIIEREVDKNKNKTAVCFQDSTITYEELNDRANRLGQDIIRHVNGKNEVVGLCLPRSIELIVAVLAILKSGCAYLPLDPEYPEERLRFMLNDTGVGTIVTTNELSSLFEQQPYQLVSVDAANSVFEDELVFPEVLSEDIAYIIYTSGSTGKPKGVPITHASIINSTKGRLDFYDENPSAFLLLSSIAFDSAKAGIFWTLCTGGKLIVSEERLEQDINKIGAVIESSKTSHTLMLPSLYHLILQHSDRKALRSLITVIVAGEASTTQMAKNHFDVLPEVKLYNEYGPTEATVWCIAHRIKTDDLSGSVPIGKPVAQAQVLLLDETHHPVPHGAVGEIHIGGPGLALRYLNRPELTEKAYVENPLVSSNGKLYKTGDLAKMNFRNEIEFLGRADHQVKIRGHRIELDEIKNAALNHISIEDAEVVVFKVNTTDQLFLYVIADKDFEVQGLKVDLAKSLPKYMVPSRVTVLDEFPRLPNGKVDKNGLSSLMSKQRPELTERTVGTSLTVVQEKIIAIWKETLKVEHIGIHDNFFEIGGDSILSIQIIAKARKNGLDFSPNDLFQHQTIAALEKRIIETQNETIEQQKSFSGILALSPIQKWYFEVHQNAPHFWNQGFLMNTEKGFSKENVKLAAVNLMRRHDALRSTFKKMEAGWTAEILSPDEIPAFQCFTIAGLSETARAEEIKSILERIQTETKLSQGPLFRTIYFEGATTADSAIILLAHHLVVDMVSWQVVLDDFVTTLKGEASLAPRTTSYAVWSDYLSELSHAVKTLNETNYWKEQIAVPSYLPVDFERPLPIFERHVQTRSYTLQDEMTTKLKASNEAYSTKTDELLLTAVAITFSRWASATRISFALERHGRETLETDMDLSNSVGWFTSFYPIALDLSGTNEYATDIVTVKERLRNVPHGGIGYGVLRYLTDTLGKVEYPQVVFNFLGQTNASEFKFLVDGVRHPESERNYLFEINAFIDGGNLKINWSYSTEHYEEKTIDELLLNFDSVLKDLMVHCTTAGQGKFTPSDFPELGLDQDDLDGLLDSLEL